MEIIHFLGSKIFTIIFLIIFIFILLSQLLPLDISLSD